MDNWYPSMIYEIMLLLPLVILYVNIMYST